MMIASYPLFVGPNKDDGLQTDGWWFRQTFANFQKLTPDVLIDRSRRFNFFAMTKRSLFYMLYRVYLLVPVVMLVMPVKAQHEYRFESITVDDGLSQSAVTDIVQDPYGYLWISTLDGLNRYDGNSFNIYRLVPGDSTSLIQNNVGHLFFDKAQRLWVVTPGALSLYQPETDDFRHHQLRFGAGQAGRYIIRDFLAVTDQQALLATQAGVLTFNLQTGAVAPASEYGALEDQNVYGVYIAPDSSRVVVNQYSVWIKASAHSPWQLALSHADPIQGTRLAGSGYYIQTGDSVYRYDVATHQLQGLARLSYVADFDGYKQRILRRSNGEFWVMHGDIDIFDGTFQQRKTLQHQSENPNSIPDYLSCLFESRDGLVWVGTNGLGLAKFNPLRSIFQFVGKFPGSPLTLSNAYIRSVYTDDDVRVYVSTVDGFDVVDLTANKSQRIPLPAGISINKILGDGQGHIWLGTNKGVYQFQQNRLTPVNFSNNTSSLLVQDMMLEDDHTVILMTTQGVWRWNTHTRALTQEVVQGTMLARRIQDVIWIEQEAELRLMRPGQQQPFKVYKHNPADPGSFPQVWTKCFYVDHEGTLWIGTWGAGLVKFDAANQTFRQYGEKEGLPNSVVYGILEDKAGHLWLSTNRGICVFDKQRGMAIRNFFKHDGLQGDEFNTRAYFQSASGKMYFGGVNGLTFFNPQAALGISYPIPKTVVTGFMIDNTRVDKLANGTSVRQVLDGARLELAWNERNFGFTVMGLGFSSPSLTRYQFTLENFMDHWVNLGNRNDITFTNIPPGEYVLRVKSCNSFGEWEEQGLKIDITIHAPFWKRSEFIAAMIILISLMVYIIYHRRTAQLRRQTEYLEGVVKERTRELQQKNEEIAAQNEEIVMQNEELVTQSEAIETRNQQLEQIRSSLEVRVQERTVALRKLNEELVDQNVQLEQFAFITAHNIRGPVARIKGLLGLLNHENIDEISTYLRTSVGNLDEVITDLNLVLNIRKASGTPFEPVSLQEQFNLVLKTLEHDIQTAGAIVRHEGVEDVRINGLRPYVYSIFYNLLHNALKYSSTRRQPVIRCACRVDDGHVHITIADNGIGIDMQYASEKIFRLYQRFHINSSGKGFGLFLVKTQVEAMGGTIQVESALDFGTTFTLVFPTRP